MTPDKGPIPGGGDESHAGGTRAPRTAAQTRPGSAKPSKQELTPLVLSAPIGLTSFATRWPEPVTG